ncbi:uncharacterized protein BDV14DRAFT_77314 [Aspergillus stella-maris]|uniref:uncharacterized protein n=1 Tax=Aspergillus stella-maris TaxID=1810926 RepID=UPI003CCDB432
MDTPDRPPVAEPLSTAIPIAQLSPELDRLQQSSINAVVTLLWPYSSSTQTLSLLLAEPDFRLRRSNGQVKVFFHGRIAQEVANTHIGIGDNVRLSLAGSRLEKNDAAIQKLGRGIAWDVHFDASAFIEVWRDSKLLSTVNIDRSSATPPPTNTITPAAAAPSTPVANGIYASEPLGSNSWQSPAFLRKSRVSFGLTDPAIDPTVEEDGYVPGKGRKRPRFSMRSNEWRLVDEPESPRDRDLPEDWMAIFDAELDKGSDEEMEDVAGDAEESAIPPSLEEPSEVVAAENIDAAVADDKADAPSSAPGPDVDRANNDAQFLRPSIVTRNLPAFNQLPDHLSHLPTDTPRLHPVPSPGLPAPSPFPTAPSPGGYFMPINGAHTTAQTIVPPAPVLEELSAIRDFTDLPPEQHVPESVHKDEVLAEPEDVSEQEDSVIPPQGQSDGEPAHDEDDAVTVYTDDVQVLPSSPRPTEAKTTTTTIPGNEDDQQAGEESEDIGVDAPGVEPDDSGSDESGPEESNAEESDSESEHEDEEEEVKKEDARRLSERFVQEEDYDTDEVSADYSENEENSAVAAEFGGYDTSRPAKRPSFPQEEDDEVSEDSRNLDEYDEEDRLDRSDVDGSDRYDYGEDYEEDEEQYDRRAGNGYSGSEAESDYDEELSPRPAPKKAEPEIIVLDSDSEDEAPPQRRVDTTTREEEDVSEQDSYGEEDEDVDEDEEVNEQDEEDKHEGLEEDYGDHENEEDEEQEYDYEQEAEEYRIDEEMENANEEEAYAQPMAEEQHVEGWHHEQEEMLMDEVENEDNSAGNHYHEPQEHPEMAIEGTAAPALLAPAGIPTDNEFSTSHEYAEDLQPPPEYAPRPNQDSLDYLATISESAQRLKPVTEAAESSYGMAIDPSLYEFAPPQDDTMVEPDEGFPRERAAETNEAAIESFEDIRERHLALQLDGASASATAPETTHEIVSMFSPEQKQLVTPGPSQQVEVEQDIDSVEDRQETLPTPNLTQESLLKLETEQPPQPLTETSAHGELEQPNTASDAAIKLETGSNISQNEEHENEEHETEPPRLIVDDGRARSLNEDQKLQASIEFDEQFEEATEEPEHTNFNRHYPGLRSKLSYFAPLATLLDHYNALVDTISIAVEVTPPTKATTGKKDFVITLQLTDPSMAGTTIYAQILRPFKPALPNPREGDAILLRNFRVKSLDHSVILVSDDTSAWAVFSPSSPEPKITGPPVEFGIEETNFATDLRQWYVETGHAMVADNQLQASVGREMSLVQEEERAGEEISRPVTPGSESLAPSDADATSIGDDLALREMRGDTTSSRGSRRRRSHRRITIHELRDGRRYTEVGSSPGDSSIHELRDGTVYANL